MVYLVPFITKPRAKSPAAEYSDLEHAAMHPSILLPYAPRP